MFEKELSQTTKHVITLLHNIKELLVISNKRQEAKDVMHAIQIYASSKNLSVPTEKMELFKLRLLDARPFTLASLISDIGNDIITAERSKQHRTKKRYEE